MINTKLLFYIYDKNRKSLMIKIPILLAELINFIHSKLFIHI